MSSEANLLTVRETATLLRQSERSILRKIHAGLIPALRLGDERGPLRVPADELKEWLASSKRGSRRRGRRGAGRTMSTLDWQAYSDWLDELPSTPRGIILTGARGETRVFARPTYEQFRAAHSARPRPAGATEFRSRASRTPRLDKRRNTLAIYTYLLEREERDREP